MRTSSLKMLIAAAFAIVLYSCSKDDSKDGGITPSNSKIGGSYTLVSMTSNLSVDLNGDGVLSTNLMTEIGAAAFDPTEPDLEIKPVFYDNELVQLMSFYLPHPTLSFDKPGKPEGAVAYTVKGLGYQYEFDNDTNKITVENNGQNSDIIPTAGRLDTIVVSGEHGLNAVFTKKYYDFATDKWVVLTITCIYALI